jgi:sortase A
MFVSNLKPLFKRPLTRRNKQMAAILLIVIGLSGFGVSARLYLNQPKPPKQVSGVDVASAPSSTKPSPRAVASYTVAPDLPKYMNIPAIDIQQTRVIKLGHLANGEITTPDNIYDAGWYEDSAKPGQSGAMFIYGHVSSWTAEGVFYNLKKLQPGDKVTITRGDNKKFTYQVVSSKVYPHDKVDMHAVLSPTNPNKPGLNLMTCTGKIIKGTSEFSERLVVFTSLASS